MKIDDLKCFEAVYKAGSIHKAAGQLFITPQGLGKNIRSLENELGTELFVRSKKGVVPTKSADFLYSRTGAIMGMMEEVMGGIRQLEEGRRRLRIGCACGVFNVLSLPELLHFVGEHSDIQITWGEYPNPEVWQQLWSNRLEYGFVVGGADDFHFDGMYGSMADTAVKNSANAESDGMDSDETFVKKRLATRPLLLLVYKGHPLYHAPAVSLDDLRHEKIIIMNEHFHMYHDFTGACQARGFTPDIVAKTADGHLLNRLCRQKVGLAVIPEFMLEDTNMGDMHAAAFKERLTWDVYGVYKKANEDLYTIRLLKSCLENISPEKLWNT